MMLVQLILLFVLFLLLWFVHNPKLKEHCCDSVPFFDKNGNQYLAKNIERDEQIIVQKWINDKDTVLELGCRYGTVSCKIASLCKKLVSLDPDKEAINTCKKNMVHQGVEFECIWGTVSNSPMKLNKVSDDGYGDTTTEDENSDVPHFTIKEIESRFGIQFDTLVADCEGCLNTVFRDNDMSQFKKVIYETDGDYTQIEEYLSRSGLSKVEDTDRGDGIRNVCWIKNNEKYIYAVPVNFLGNCLRYIVSMKILADFCNRPFKIDLSRLNYNKEKEALRLLFEEYIDENPVYRYYKQEDICYIDSPTNTSPTLESYFTNIPDESFGSSSIYSIKHVEMSIEDFLKHKIETYKNLNWPTFNLPSNLSEIIGVHIRFTDNLRDPSKNNLNTPKHIFLEKIETIPKPFLLCSDNQDIINELKNKYKNDVILPEKIGNENLQPLYEMMLLSRTKHIIGSYASTFSYESSFFIGTTLEVYENNHWKVYDYGKFSDDNNKNL